MNPAQEFIKAKTQHWKEKRFGNSGELIVHYDEIENWLEEYAKNKNSEAINCLQELIEMYHNVNADGEPKAKIVDMVALWIKARDIVAENKLASKSKDKSPLSVIRRLPTAEEVKRWHQILTGLGEEEMKSDIEATFV